MPHLQYTCNACTFKSFSIKRYVSHFVVHRHVHNLQFPCPLQTCVRTFSTYSAFTTHLSRDHKSGRVPAAKYRKNIPLKCTLAFCHRTLPTLFEFIAHLKEHLVHDDVIKCPFASCSKEYKTKNAFTVHMYRSHRDCQVNLIHNEHLIPNSPVSSDIPTDINQTVEHDLGVDISAPLSTDNTDLPDYEDDDSISEEQYTRSLALFYLKLQSQYLMPASTVQVIVDELAYINDLRQGQLKRHVSQVIGRMNLDPGEMNELIEALLSQNTYKTTHDSNTGKLHSEHLRKSYFKKEFKYVSPQRVYLGRDNTNLPRVYHYVPVKDTIARVYNDSFVMWQHSNPQPSKDGILTDFSDGSFHKSNPLFCRNMNTLKLILFQDGFEIVNPLGSAKSKHKLLGVYMSIGNMHPQFRSSTAQMQLVLLCRERDLKLFGVERVFARLISDLQDVELNGVDVGHMVLKGSIVAIAGDNLGSHFIGGFTENFSTGEFFCRYCTITKHAFNYPSQLGPLRNVDQYKSAVQIVAESNGNLLSYEGIKKNSPFNDLQFFHACTGLPPCLGHDLFEGVVDYDLAAAIKYFVKKKWFTFDILNRRLLTFKYLGSDAANKPIPVSAAGKRLGGNATQNWCLLRLLPIIIGDRIGDVDDSVWQMCLLLRKLVELICAPRLCYGQVAYMQTLAEEYVEDRIALFSSIRLRPKHHYLLHYSDLTMKFGPLIRLWTLRFESKHPYFKRCARNCMNFKNITHTLSERHQMLQAYNGAGSLFPSRVTATSMTTFYSDLYSPEIKRVTEARNLNSYNACAGDMVTYDGTMYRKGMYVVLDDNENNPILGCIKIVLVQENVNVFLVVAKHTSFLLPEFGILGVNTQDIETLCVSLSELHDYYPLPMYSFRSDCVLTLHHALVECSR